MLRSKLNSDQQMALTLSAYGSRSGVKSPLDRRNASGISSYSKHHKALRSLSVNRMTCVRHTLQFIVLSKLANSVWISSEKALKGNSSYVTSCWVFYQCHYSLSGTKMKQAEHKGIHTSLFPLAKSGRNVGHMYF